MTSPIKIGFLTPYSGVYPSYSDHLMAGILLGLYPSDINHGEFQFVPVYSKQGGINSTAEAVSKLIFFDRVDIISGLVSYKSIPTILPDIERYNKLGFFDMGEYIPYFEHLNGSPDILFITADLAVAIRTGLLGAKRIWRYLPGGYAHIRGRVPFKRRLL